MKNQAYFLPMTGMNLARCIDQGMLLPPGFLARLNFHADSTEKFSKVILATKEPLHFDCCGWSDEASEEETAQMQQLEEQLRGELAKRLEKTVEEELSKRREEKIKEELLVIQKKVMNFPVLVEINAKLREDQITSLEIKNKKGEKPPELFGLLKPIALNKQVRILTPGSKTRENLKEHLVLIADSFPFEIEVFPEVETLLKEEDLNRYSLNDAEQGMDLDRVQAMDAFLGVANLLGTSSSNQDWDAGNAHVAVGCAVDLIVRSKFGLATYEDQDDHYPAFAGLNAFREMEDDKPSTIIKHTHAALKNLAASDEGKEGAKDSAKQQDKQTEIASEAEEESDQDAEVTSSSVETPKNADLTEIHDLAIQFVAEKCLRETDSSSTPFKILAAVGERLQEVAKNRDKADQKIARKYAKAFTYVEEVGKGMGDIAQIFSEKTKEYRALRAGALFAIRSKIKEFMDWPKNEKPGEANVDDYFTGILFLGLFHGFCGLRPTLKSDWRPFASLALQDEEMPSASLRANWSAENNRVLGKLTLDYAGCATSISLQADTRRLLLNYLAKLMEKEPPGESLSEDQKKVLGTLAEDSGLDEKHQLQFTDIGEGELAPHIVSGKLAIPVKSFTHRDWDYPEILNWLKETPPELPPVSMVPILAKELGYPVAEITDAEPPIDQRTMLQGYLQRLHDKHVDDEPLPDDKSVLFDMLAKDLGLDSQYKIQYTNILEKDLDPHLFSGKLAVPIRSFREQDWDYNALFELLQEKPPVLPPSQAIPIISKTDENSPAGN